MNYLAINTVISYPRTLLLDEIALCDFEHWRSDEFAATGAVFIECKEKAFEARQKIIEQERAEQEAYYRAYCD